ncbi:MAG: cadherin-like domain-containing protein, partial [Gammaproteobacteria bacterium]|nr:cadherin-like domain-containing protein [Gammaproteobacteria bacterium]
FVTSSGQVTVLTTTQPPASLSDFTYPVGWFSFAISGLTPGATVTVQVVVPEAIVIITGLVWAECNNLIGGCAIVPYATYDGGNTVTLTLTDGGVGDADGTVNGVITDPGAPAMAKASNGPPVASGGTLKVNENASASGTLKATDADGDALTFSIVAQPTHGSVTLDDAATGAYTYTPTSGYSGADSFTFKANDGQADSNVATISITVNAAPPPPPPPGGGGGALGDLGLGLLALIGLAGLIRRRR